MGINIPLILEKNICGERHYSTSQSIGASC